MKFKLCLSVSCILVLIGCATLSPNADPFVVRVEQTQNTAKATFDFVLRVDNADRGFWETNAPAFHNFCEWLRTPLFYDLNNTNVPRCVLMQLDVQDVKLKYKSSRDDGNSNALYTVWVALDTALRQSSSWSNIVSTPTH
jgi:hypothetical protein